MELSDQAALSYYRPVADIRAEHGICLVQHTETGKFYVRKALTVYNLDVYKALILHPIINTPKIYAAIEDKEASVLTVIEEFLPGDSLQELLDTQGIFKEEQVVSIILQLSRIVRDLHQENPAIIHRDIKPSNIILSPDGIVKLLDFNAAKFASSQKNMDTVLLGTAGFAAPEQYGFAASGIQADLYSIGVLINVLLTGKLPSEQIAEGSLAPIISKCTQIDPSNRFPDIDSLITALEKPGRKYGISAAFSDSAKIWRRFLPPGFRNGSPVHMVLAALGYFLLFDCGLSLTVESGSITELFLNRIAFCLAGLAVIFFSCNYLGIQERLPFLRHHNRILRFILVAACDAAIVFFILLALSIILLIIS